MSLLKQTIRVVIFLLGIYEFLAIYTLWQVKDSLQSSSQRFVLLKQDVITQHKSAFYLLLILDFYLGINRIAWAVTTQLFPGQNNLILWLNVLLTHLAELALFYSVAFLPHFNPQNVGLVDLLKGVASLEIGNKNSRLTLFVVPLIVLLILLHGPSAEIGKQRSSKKHD